MHRALRFAFGAALLTNGAQALWRFGLQRPIFRRCVRHDCRGYGHVHDLGHSFRHEPLGHLVSWTACLIAAAAPRASAQSAQRADVARGQPGGGGQISTGLGSPTAIGLSRVFYSSHRFRPCRRIRLNFPSIKRGPVPLRKAPEGWSVSGGCRVGQKSGTCRGFGLIGDLNARRREF